MQQRWGYIEVVVAQHVRERTPHDPDAVQGSMGARIRVKLVATNVERGFIDFVLVD